MKLINKIKQKIKDEVMLYEYHARGDLTSMKAQSRRFDKLFLSIQLKIVIFLVAIGISILSFLYFRTFDINLYYSIPMTLILIYLIKVVLSAIAKALIKLSESEK